MTMNLIRFSLALLVALPLFAIGPERAVSPHRAGTAMSESHGTLAASNGESFFLVWSDRRLGDKWSVWAARFTPAGEPIDAQPILLHDNARTHTVWYSDASWNGAEYVVDKIYDYTTGEYHLARVSSDGRVAIENEDEKAPLTWRRGATGEMLAIYPDRFEQLVAFIEPDGTRRIWVSIPTKSRMYADHAVPLDGGDWAVVLTGGDGMLWVRINRTGIVDSKWVTHNYPLATAANGPSAAALTSSDTVVKWSNDSSQIVLRRTTTWSTLDSRGEVRTGTLESFETVNHGLPRPAVAAGGDAFHFAYTRRGLDELNDLQYFRVSEGNVEQQTIEAGRKLFDSHHVYFASTPSRVAMTWLQPCGADRPACRVALRTFDHKTTAATAPTTHAAPSYVVRQDSPAAASNATASLIAWREHELESSVRARFTSAAGPSVLLTVSNDVEYGFGEIVGPQVAARANGFVVAWVERDSVPGHRYWSIGKSHLMIRRYDANGSAVDAAPLRVAMDYYVGSLAVATRGDGYQLAWIQAAGPIFTLTIPATGAAGAPVMILPQLQEVSRTDIAAAPAGDSTAIVWVETDVTSEARKIVGVRVDANGTIGTPVMIERAFVGRELEVAANQSELAVVTAPETPRDCLQIDRATFSLAPIRPTLKPFCGEPGTALAGVPFWDGGRWWVAPRGSATTPLRVRTYDANWIETASIDFGVIDNAVFAGNTIVYERYDETAGGVTRVFFRSLTDVPRRRAVR